MEHTQKCIDKIRQELRDQREKAYTQRDLANEMGFKVEGKAKEKQMEIIDQKINMLNQIEIWVEADRNGE